MSQAATRRSARIAGTKPAETVSTLPPPVPRPATKRRPKAKTTTTDNNITNAWITLYHALFITDKIVNETSRSLASLPNMWVSFNTYFAARAKVFKAKDVPAFRPFELGTFTEHVQNLIPNTVAHVDALRNENEEMIPTITEEMLERYVALRRDLALPADIDFRNTTKYPDVTSFLEQCLIDPYLQTGPPQLSSPTSKWYDNLAAYERQKPSKDGLSWEPAGPPEGQESTHYVIGDKKLRDFQNMAVIPPIGYGRNPRRLLNEEERKEIAENTDIKMDDVGEPWDEFAAAVQQGEEMHRQEREKYARAWGK